MKLIRLTIAALILCGVAEGTTREPAEYKTMRLSAREVVVSCKGEGVAPKVTILKDYFVVVSCPRP